MLQARIRGLSWAIAQGSVVVMGLAIGLAGGAVAQIVPDGTLGAEGSRVTPNVQIKGGAADRIDGGAARGANLFHSFQEFNVGNGQRVYFANPANVRNILTRVTGNNLSNIAGNLGGGWQCESVFDESPWHCVWSKCASGCGWIVCGDDCGGDRVWDSGMV